VDGDMFRWAMVLNLALLLGGVLVILMAMYQRGKTREMQHRERLAMIERGLAPAPEQDPAAFEAWRTPQRHSAATSIGVVIVALGFGLMLLIGITANAVEAAVGVGGAIAVVGFAFIVIGELQRRGPRPPMSGYYPPTPPQPPPAPGQGDRYGR